PKNIPIARPACFLVLAFNEQPVLVTLALARAHSHQMPAAVKFLAVEIEIEMAFGVALVRIAFGSPGSAIRDHHRAAAIFAFRDGAFERVVLVRMILDLDSRRFSLGSRLGPRVTAQLFITPASSSRRS